MTHPRAKLRLSLLAALCLAAGPEAAHAATFDDVVDFIGRGMAMNLSSDNAKTFAIEVVGHLASIDGRIPDSYIRVISDSDGDSKVLASGGELHARDTVELWGAKITVEICGADMPHNGMAGDSFQLPYTCNSAGHRQQSADPGAAHASIGQPASTERFVMEVVVLPELDPDLSHRALNIKILGNSPERADLS